MLLYGQIWELSGPSEYVLSATAKINGGEKTVAIMLDRFTRQTAEANWQVRN